MIFNIEFWWRSNGGDDKDFDQTKIESDTFENAVIALKREIPFIFKVTKLKNPQ